MKYHSTISHKHSLTLEEAITLSVAPDSGLLMPDSLPVIPRAIISTMPEMPLTDIAYCIAASLFGQDMELDDIREIALKTYSHPMPLVKLDNSISALELWHGPTGTAKDFEVEFLAGMLEKMVVKRGKEVRILATATSNAAKAIANTYADRQGLSAVLLVPRIGQRQYNMENGKPKSSNIKLIDVRGTKQQCHRLVIEALNDKDIQQRNCYTAASTLNIGALLPQIIHFFYGYSRALAQGADPKQVVFSVPCNNLAGVTAAVMAKRMGLPIKRIVAGGHSDFYLPQYLKSGVYPHPEVDLSLPYALEAIQPTNLPRLKDLYEGSHQAIANEIVARSYDSEQGGDTIITTQCSMHYDLNPHSACAMQALAETIQPGESGIVLTTTNPAPRNHTARIPASSPIAPLYPVLKQILSNS